MKHVVHHNHLSLVDLDPGILKIYFKEQINFFGSLFITFAKTVTVIMVESQFGEK